MRLYCPPQRGGDSLAAERESERESFPVAKLGLEMGVQLSTFVVTSLL